MKNLMLSFIALAFSGGALLAQDLSGVWQGTLQAGGRDLRIVIKISKADDASLKAVLYSLDQAGGQGLPAKDVTFQGGNLKIEIPGIGAYEGKLGADGSSIPGTWTQGAPRPLNLKRATAATEWTIPEPPPPPKRMAADATPVFEVSTIKPSKPEERFSILVNRSGLLNTTNTSLSDLIKFAYGLHARQITGGPAWLETDKYTVTGKPDTEGMPSVPQLRGMMQKLLVDRFQLTFHRDKKDLSVYAITVAKGGVKMTKNESNPTGLPGFGGGGPRGMNVRNSTMAEFASILQANLLERPVVDQTGLASARYDFILKWTPDASQLAGLGPNVPPPAEGADAPPDLFAAFQQQLGLKLESTKASTDVLVIDRAEKPSAN